MLLQDMGLRMVRLMAIISFVVLLSLASPGKALEARASSLRSARRSLQGAPSEVQSSRLFVHATHATDDNVLVTFTEVRD